MPAVKFDGYSYNPADAWPTPGKNEVVYLDMASPNGDQTGYYISRKISDSQIVLRRLRWWHRAIIWLRSKFSRKHRSGNGS